MALQTDLQDLRTSARDAAACVRQNNCLALGRRKGDAGDRPSGLHRLLQGDAGVTDAAGGELRALVEALDSCVDSACVSACPPDNDDGGRL